MGAFGLLPFLGAKSTVAECIFFSGLCKAMTWILQIRFVPWIVAFSSSVGNLLFSVSLLGRTEHPIVLEMATWIRYLKIIMYFSSKFPAGNGRGKFSTEFKQDGWVTQSVSLHSFPTMLYVPLFTYTLRHTETAWESQFPVSHLWNCSVWFCHSCPNFSHPLTPLPFQVEPCLHWLVISNHEDWVKAHRDHTERT